jgi:hypothetical protein
MKDGCVEEEGQHEELFQANGIYTELVQAQQFERRGETSAAPSIMSNSRSAQKEQPQSDESTEASRSIDTSPAPESPKLGAGQLIARCVALSRQELPAIIVGLVCSIISGGIIIGEVSLHCGKKGVAFTTILEAPWSSFFGRKSGLYTVQVTDKLAGPSLRKLGGATERHFWKRRLDIQDCILLSPIFRAGHNRSVVSQFWQDGLRLSL